MHPYMTYSHQEDYPDGLLYVRPHQGCTFGHGCHGPSAARFASQLSHFCCLCRLGIVADIGQTQNSSVTYQHLVANKPDVGSFTSCLHSVLYKKKQRHAVVRNF